MTASRADFIIPECYVDTNLVSTLAGLAGCNHQKGCNQVAKTMREKFANRFAVGIIDADKRRPSYLSEFQEIASSAHLSVMRHASRPHFVVLIAPAVEGFILSCVEGANLDMTDFGLSQDLSQLTEQTKNIMSNRDPRFARLFHALEASGEMRLLKSLLALLIANGYATSTSDIAQTFAR